MTRLAPLILLACLASGCGVAVIGARETRPDGTVVEIHAVAGHVASDPVLEEASYGDLHIKGFKGTTVVEAVKGVWDGLVGAVVRLVIAK